MLSPEVGVFFALFNKHGTYRNCGIANSIKPSWRVDGGCSTSNFSQWANSRITVVFSRVLTYMTIKNALNQYNSPSRRRKQINITGKHG